jgi:hypothetical protein
MKWKASNAIFHFKIILQIHYLKIPPMFYVWEKGFFLTFSKSKTFITRLTSEMHMIKIYENVQR